jgi:hypothetical protein
MEVLESTVVCGGRPREAVEEDALIALRNEFAGEA